MIDLDQDLQKVRIKKEILMKVYVLFIKSENLLLMLSKVEDFH